MSKSLTSNSLDIILEALFTGADEEECAKRDISAPKIMRDEWIEEFLKRKDIKKLSDGSYDVDGDVNLRNLKLQKLPLKFNKVGGYFWCYSNKLTTLEGAPETVGGSFSCDTNQLTTLEGAPETVGGSFSCHRNQLTTLEGAPKTVGGYFGCDNNQLTSLEGAPKTVGGGFSCYNNQLTTLEGAPKTVGGYFWCDNNKKKFTKEDVRAVCKVKGAIDVSD